MKKLLFLLLIPSLSLAATTPVTESQVDQAMACFKAIVTCGVDGLQYAQGIKGLFRSGFTLQIPGSTVTFTIPQADQTTAIDVSVYQAKKQACVTAFNGCP